MYGPSFLKFHMISIVIPALNEEKSLPRCLASLLAQDYAGDVEIIVADNGSTDATAAIAARFGARVVSCPEPPSVFYARQAGADAATGDIIAQADADTVYPPDWLGRIADRFARRPDVVAVTGRFEYDGRAPWWGRLEYFLRHAANRAGSLFGRPLVISGATFAFRRAAFIALGGYRGLDYSADQYGLAARLRKAGKVLYDKDLRVLTSARAVQKPFARIVLDLFGHLARWTGYVAGRGLGSLPDLSLNGASRRWALRLLVVPVVVIGVFGYGYFFPASQIFGQVYYQGPPTTKTIALTFDDGPNPPYTDQILATLATDNVTATFFCIGMNVQRYPDTAKAILAEGSVIGNHSYSHDANHALTAFGARDLTRAEQVIYQTIGVRPGLYCPPHGKKSPWEVDAVHDLGMNEVTWNIAANDQHVFAYWGKPTPQQFADQIVKQAVPGGIILLHDGYGTSHGTAQADKSLTVQALPLIINQLKAEGYTFVTVPQLLKIPAYVGATSASGPSLLTAAASHQ
jgi:peptidoglycan/xylan/chitin deacetylase (PgdA/CDA1 family)/GT2 family glycosyltransferase